MGEYIQIMPAPKNMYAIYLVDGEEVRNEILCLALTENGYIVAIDFAPDGFFGEPIGVSNFVRFELEPNKNGN